MCVGRLLAGKSPMEVDGETRVAHRIPGDFPAIQVDLLEGELRGTGWDTGSRTDHHEWFDEQQLPRAVCR